MNEKKVLLIAKDAAYQRRASKIFEEVNAQVITAQDVMVGMSHIITYRPDLIILDVSMPEQEGLQICKLIRQFTNTPLILLSAQDRDQLMLQGLEAGADDFLKKNAHPEILLARVKAVMRRSEQSNDFHPAYNYDDGHLKIDLKKHRILINDKQIKLTPIEFRLMAYLAVNQGKVLTFKQILFNVWGLEYKGNDEYVHVYISHLRNKIEEDTKKPLYIQSIHGVGYLFEMQEYRATR